MGVINMEKEFTRLIASRIYHGAIKKAQQYNKDNHIVDIPEHCKMFEDKLTTRAGWYVDLIIKQGRLNEVYLQEFSKYFA